MPEPKTLTKEEEQLELNMIKYIKAVKNQDHNSSNILERAIIKDLNLVSKQNPLPSNITQKILMKWCKSYMKNTRDENKLKKLMSEIMSNSFLDRLLLGKMQKGYEENKNYLAKNGARFIKNFIFSGPLKETVKSNFLLVRPQIYSYLEKNDGHTEEEKKHLSNINKTAQSALKTDWEEFCRQNKDPTINFNSGNKVFSSIGFLFNAKSLPKYITKEDLLTFATADPARFFKILNLKNQNFSLLRQLGDLNIFKETLKTERNSIENEIIEIKKEIKKNNPLISDKIDKANSKKRDLTLIVAKESIEDIKAKKAIEAIEAIEKEIIELEKEIIQIEKAKNPLIRHKIDRADNKKEDLAKLDRLIATKEEEMALENRRNSLSQTSDLLKSQPTLAQTIAFQLTEDSNTLSNPVKEAMRAAANQLLNMPEGPEKPAEYYTAIFDKIESMKIAVPGTSTEKYRKMVYAHANAEQAVESILNSIDEKIKANPDFVNHHENKASEILTYLEALKTKWLVDQKTFKIRDATHETRMKSLDECIHRIKTSEKTYNEEWMRVTSISTALGKFTTALDILPESFRDTKDVKENLTWLKTKYVVPKKATATEEAKAEPAAKTLGKSTAGMFSLFNLRAPREEPVKNAANDSLYSVKTPGKE